MSTVLCVDKCVYVYHTHVRASVRVRLYRNACVGRTTSFCRYLCTNHLVITRRARDHGRQVVPCVYAVPCRAMPWRV